MANETLSPARNFALPEEERVRALTAGPPAYLRRLRAIEDLEALIAQEIAARWDEALEGGLRGPELAARVCALGPRAAIARHRDLVERHNRFYPIEANLPVSVRTGELCDRSGRPWRPRPIPSLDELVAAERARRDQGGAAAGGDGPSAKHARPPPSYDHGG